MEDSAGQGSQAEAGCENASFQCEEAWVRVCGWRVCAGAGMLGCLRGCRRWRGGLRARSLLLRRKREGGG
eukprot:3314505-Rhodomonas_salina.1